MSEAIRIVEIKRELEKYGSVREKVLRLNEIGNFKIFYGVDYIDVVGDDELVNIHYEKNAKGGCIICQYPKYYYGTRRIQLKSVVGKQNNIYYYVCLDRCSNKSLCTNCLREKQNCSLSTKQKITFWLCFPKMPKDIRKLITNLFFKN